MLRILAELKSAFGRESVRRERRRVVSLQLHVEALEIRPLMTTVIPFQPSPYSSTTPANITQPGQYALTGTLTGSAAATSVQSQEFEVYVNLPKKAPSTVSVTLDSSTGPSIEVLLDVGAGPGVNIRGSTVTPFHGFISGDSRLNTPVVFASGPNSNTIGFGVYIEDINYYSQFPIVSSYQVDLDVESTRTTPPPPPPPPASAVIAINDTPATSDNITLFNPPSIGIPLTQTIPANVHNTSSTTQTFQLSVSPPSAAKLSQTSVTLPPDKSMDVIITPTADSTVANDVHIIATDAGVQVAEDSMTIASVTFGTTPALPSLHIRNTDTPVTMSDRIPPTANTPLYVNVAPNLTGSGESISLAVTGQSSLTGTATLNGSNTPIAITKSGTVSLVGTTQTAPADGNNRNNLTAPNARKLFLTVTERGTTALQSKGFSIAAIPMSYSVYKIADNSSTAPKPYGFTVGYKWQDDSGQSNSSGSLSDLIGVQALEIISSYNQSGPFAGGTLEVQHSYQDASSFTFATDNHGWAFGSVKFQAGSATSDQLFVFEDSRTGDEGIVVPNSGFRITRSVKFDSVAKIWVMTTTEIAAPITIGSLASQAGIVTDKTNGNFINRIQQVY